MDELCLIRHRLKFVKLFESNLLKDPKVNINKYINDMYIVSIKGYLWGEKTKELFFSHPVDWWQAFKERWFPTFLLKWYPVKYKTHYWSARLLYPDFDIQMPDENNTIVLSEWTEENEDTS